MQYKKSKDSLQVVLATDFNLNAVKGIRNLFGNRNELHIDLTHSRFVNTEAVIFLHNLLRDNKKIRIKNPPKIFYEVLHILGLSKVWDLKSIVEK
ncbi:MAG: hypothetical protein ACFCU6_06370 [Balneolaceae bacterium]